MLKTLPLPGPLYVEPPPTPDQPPDQFVEYVRAEPPLDVVEAPVIPPSEGLTLEQATGLLRGKVMELLKATPAQVAPLNVEIQKLRIICMVLREVELGVTDPNAYKELSLMNKMLTGKDLEAEADRKQTIEEEQAALTVLAQRGIKAESAGRILRTLTSLMAAREEPPLDDEEPADINTSDRDAPPTL